MLRDLTIIVPVYNEISRLLDGFREISGYLQKHYPQAELLLVDDGSSIQARDVLLHSSLHKRVQAKIQNKTLRILRLPKNQGKGAAIAYGVAHAKGKVIIFMDIDCSVPLTYLTDVLSALKNHSVAIGSRRLAASKILVHQPFIREFSGQIYTFLTNLLCQTRVTDATCGFKGFERKTAQQVFSALHIKRWSFDAELLFLIRHRNIPLTEVPVTWSNKAGSRVKVRESLLSAVDLLKIRLYWFGRK